MNSLPVFICLALCTGSAHAGPKAAKAILQGNVEFGEAVLAESCAPHDASSMFLAFTVTADQSFPRMTVNWWGPSQPPRKPGTYTLSNGSGGKASRDFASSYCPSKGSCAMIKEIFVKIRVNEKGEGEAEAEGTTLDGATIRAKAPLKVLPKQPGKYCG